MVGGELFEFCAAFGGIELVGCERLRAAGPEEILKTFDEWVALLGDVGECALGRPW